MWRECCNFVGVWLLQSKIALCYVRENVCENDMDIIFCLLSPKMSEWIARGMSEERESVSEEHEYVRKL